VQQPIPIVVGGHSQAAFRRAVARAQGWYGFALTPELAAASIAGLRAAASDTSRPVALGTLEVTVTPRGRLTKATAAAFAELGVGRLVPFPPPTPDGIARTIDAALEAVADL
jgi:alkanesulfonate monooxygenase SsuD/methylene tetrahydromethanopterin reductase-like flavin-dependent oxidoreductase (luciferase family)